MADYWLETCSGIGLEWLVAERAQAWCQRCGTSLCGKVFGPVWIRGELVEFGPCVSAETVKACVLISLRMMAEENARHVVRYVKEI